MERIACITIVLCFYPSFVQGAGKIVVNPNPALIYNGATPGTAVLSVKAYDTETNHSMSNVALTNSQDSSYFKLIQEKIPTEWILQVKQTIDKPVDYQFMFSVYGYLQQEPQDRRILINVTQVNLHAPSFEKTEYNFLALRNGMDYNLTDIGYVKAIDLDNELYNKQFHYHILHAEDNFAIDLETGLIEMTHNLPPDIDNVTFSVTAIDGGSPQRLNTTTVVIKITDSPRNAVCPVGFQPHGDSCYHFSIDTEDFPGAMTMCREFGAYLVEINSADENNYLVGQSRAKGASFWIGLSDLLQPGTYMWMESKVVWNKATDYSNWHPGQPDNNDENCVNLEDTLDWDWNDLTCHDNERYICEMKNEENQVIG